MRGLAGSLSNLTVASSQYDILLCSATLVSDMLHVWELLVPEFGRLVLLCRGKMNRHRGMATYDRDCYGAFRQPKFECCCREMLVFRVCGVRQKLCVFSLYRNPDLDDRIFDCLLASMLPCRLWMSVPLSCFWVIWMAIIRSGWGLWPRTDMELQHLTSKLSTVAISWLSAEPMHVVEHLTSWWLMFLT